jgi:hypothetical protein
MDKATTGPVTGLIKQTLKSIRDTRLTYFIVLTGASFIGILHLLPTRTQQSIADFIRTPVISALLLIGTFIIGYFNIIGGIIILVLVACLIMPATFSNTQQGQLVTEGFVSSSDGNITNDKAKEKADNSLSSDNKTIKDLLKPGKFRKELDEARKLNKDLFEKEMANNKFMEYEHNKQKKKKASHKSSKQEKFQAELEGARAIQQRKFNPANQEDVNLLETMEIADEIRDRIKYNYEDKKYLKRYIKEKLEEVVDMLDLVQDE